MAKGMTMEVICRFSFEGTHCWPDVVVHEHLREVAYLRHKHRHMFYVEARAAVEKHDREIEIIALRRDLIEWVEGLFPRGDLGTMSCEHFAEAMLNRFTELTQVTVLEDNENGATATRR